MLENCRLDLAKYCGKEELAGVKTESGATFLGAESSQEVTKKNQVPFLPIVQSIVPLLAEPHRQQMRNNNQYSRLEAGRKYPISIINHFITELSLVVSSF